MSSNTIYTLPDVHQIAYYNGEDRSYYVYVYLDPRNGEPFYVGKGKEERAWDHVTDFQNGKQHYNKLFQRKLNKLFEHDLQPEIEIYADGLAEGDALELETSLIKHYGRLYSGDGCLVNVVLDSRKAFSGMVRPLVDPNVYKFTHQDGTVFYGTQRDMVIQKGLNISCVCRVVNKNGGTTNGWFLGDTPPEKITIVGQKYTFEHIKTGETITCTQNDLSKTYGLHNGEVCKVVNNETRSVGGWYYYESLLKEDRNHYNEYKVEKRELKNHYTGEIAIKTLEEMCSFLGNNWIYRVYRKEKEHIGGWTLADRETPKNLKDYDVYHLYNKISKQEFKGTRDEIKENIPELTSALVHLITKKNNSAKGWCLYNNPTPTAGDNAKDFTIYRFYNEITKEEFIGTRREFIQKVRGTIPENSVHTMINKKKPHKKSGWYIIFVEGQG